MKQSQIQFILKELSERGRISRNFCLQNYISKLASRICDIERKYGLKFKKEWVFYNNDWAGKDFVYSCLKGEAKKNYKKSLI